MKHRRVYNNMWLHADGYEVGILVCCVGYTSCLSDSLNPNRRSL